MMKQEYTLRIYKADRRLTRVSKYGSRNKVGQRCVGSYQFVGQTAEGMEREVRELKSLYAAKDGFSFEYFPTYKTVKSLMTGQDVVIETECPRSCDPSSELYWSM
jgi:hypothetical protein